MLLNISLDDNFKLCFEKSRKGQKFVSLWFRNAVRQGV